VNAVTRSQYLRRQTFLVSRRFWVGWWSGSSVRA
jgi:hypothetical protein